MSIYCIIWRYETSLVKPLSRKTAMPQRLYSVLKTCQHAVESPKICLKIASYSVYTSSQRPYSVPTMPPQRHYSAPKLLRRASSCCSVFTTRSRRAHSVLTARTQCFHGDHIVKGFYLYFIFWATLFCEHGDLFLLFEAIRHSIQQLLKCLKSRRTCSIFSNIHKLSSVHWIAFIMMCLSWGLFLLNN